MYHTRFGSGARSADNIARMNLALSRGLAYALAPFFLVVDVWRRFGRWHEWPIILDDVLGGAFGLVALVIARRSASEGRVYLAAVWGYGVAMMYQSFFGQLMDVARPDPSGLPSRFVVAVKAILLILCFVGLVGALRRPPRPAASPRAAS